MRAIQSWVLAASLFATTVVFSSAYAGATDPLFINLTSQESHRAEMAIGFGKNQLERGHPLTIFLNDKAVLLGSKRHAKTFQAHQAMLKAVIAQGGTVYICQSCMKKYKVMSDDLITGLQLSTPDLTGAALFQDNTKTLSW